MDRWTKTHYDKATKEKVTRQLRTPARKVYLRAFLCELLELSPSQVSKLFAPTYSIQTLQSYLKERGYKPPRTTT